MSNFVFVGDIHGNESVIRDVIAKYPTCKIIQVGDFGIGFETFTVDFLQFQFIRGNHDNPFICQEISTCHDTYFYDHENSILFISGAESIDKHLRVEGVSWWKDEELSLNEMYKLLSDLENLPTPKMVVTHDAPSKYVESVFGSILYRPNNSRTSVFLDHVLGVWTDRGNVPEYWIHGHYHKSNRCTYNGVRMISLGIDEVFLL